MKFRIQEDRNKNAREVIRAGLRLLEDEEQNFYALKTAIEEGIVRGIAVDFDSKEQLKKLKMERKKNG